MMEIIELLFNLVVIGFLLGLIVFGCLMSLLWLTEIRLKLKHREAEIYEREIYEREVRQKKLDNYLKKEGLI